MNEAQKTPHTPEIQIATSLQKLKNGLLTEWVLTNCAGKLTS